MKLPQSYLLFHFGPVLYKSGSASLLFPTCCINFALNRLPNITQRFSNGFKFGLRAGHRKFLTTCARWGLMLSCISMKFSPTKEANGTTCCSKTSSMYLWIVMVPLCMTIRFVRAIKEIPLTA